MPNIIFAAEKFFRIMVTPNWVSFELLQEALNNYFDEDVRLSSFTSTNAVPEGDNYTSDLFRTTLTYMDMTRDTKSSLSVIVKCGNEDGGAKTDLAQKLRLFDKDIEMFTKTFPAVYKILGTNHTLSSRCLYAELKPHSTIIFEDLTTSGFQMLPRHDGLDFEHCLKVAEKLAQMHAASVVMFEEDPSSMKCYKEGLYIDEALIKEWVSVGFCALTDACSRWPGCEKYSDKLAALGQEAIKLGLEACRKKTGGFHVLNHGDLWMNNIMFSYDDKKSKMKDMKFVDFQLSIFSSPAVDLHYFISTSTAIDVKLNCLELILDFYYDNLFKNLTDLHYSVDKVPSRKEFLEDYKARAFYGLMAAATVLPLVKASKRKDASFDNTLKDDSIQGFRYHIFNNQRYRQHMEFLLPYYENFGVFEQKYVTFNRF